MNGSQLRGAVKEYLNMPNQSPSATTGKPTNAYIDSRINECCREIYSDLVARKPRRFAITTTLAYTADTDSVALPAAAQQLPLFLVEGLISGDTLKFTLDPSSRTEFRNYFPTGTPQIYAIEFNNIWLRPRPTVAVTLTLHHDPTVADLADNTSPSWLVSPLPPRHCSQGGREGAPHHGRSRRRIGGGVRAQLPGDGRLLRHPLP